MSRVSLSSLAFAASVAILASGCKVYDPALLDRDAGPGVDGTVPTGCGARPPPRPAAPDDGADVGEVTFALRDVQLDQPGDQWATIGYDLDGFCTTAPDYESECIPPNHALMPALDGDFGIDNVFGQFLYPLVAVVVPGLQDASRNYQMLGDGSVIVRIFGWNGTQHDSRVNVIAAVTVFATPAVDGDVAPVITFAADGEPMMPDGSAPPPPQWDGHDYFWGRDDNFLGGSESQPIIRDDNAYVSNGYLVINLPERTDFIFPGMDVGVLVRLTEAIAVARLGATLEDFTVAGRWSVLDLLDTASAVGVCTPENIETFQNQIDRIADVRSRAGTGGPDVDCDAISVGIRLQGYTARWGGVAPGPPLADACP